MAETVRYHDAAEREFLRTSEWRERMGDIGRRITNEARANAPRGNPSHGGALSIHEVTELDAVHGWTGRVSWDKAHYYMRFQELGTEYQTEQPFLEPALIRVAGRV